MDHVQHGNWGGYSVKLATPTYPWVLGYSTHVPCADLHTSPSTASRRQVALKIVSDMRTTPSYSPTNLESMADKRNDPVGFSVSVQGKLSDHRLVLVTDLPNCEMYFDLDFLHRHFALDPSETVNVTGACHLDRSLTMVC